jgi:hypothetical protein
MKESVLAHLRDRLLDERIKAARASEAFDRDARTAQESSGELSHYPLHPADAGTDTMTDELSLRSPAIAHSCSIKSTMP